MGYPTRRDPVGQGRDILERIDLLERRTARGYTLPDRLRPAIATFLDANDMVETGGYLLPAGGLVLNSPDSTYAWLIEAAALASESVYQKAVRIGSPIAEIYAEEWVRARAVGGGAWSAWSLLNRPTTAFSPEPLSTSVLSIGNGTMSGRYEVANRVLTGRIRITFGSTTTLSGDLIMIPPLPVSGNIGLNVHDGDGRLNFGGTALFNAVVLVTTAGVYIRTNRTGGTGAAYLVQTPLSASVPSIWGTGHVIDVAFSYPIQP